MTGKKFFQNAKHILYIVLEIDEICIDDKYEILGQLKTQCIISGCPYKTRRLASEFSNGNDHYDID